MNTLEILTSARNLISDPNNWCSISVSSAKSFDDRYVDAWSNDACKWGILGALTRVQETQSYSGQAYNELDAVLIKKGSYRGNIGGFNQKSTTTHDDVMDLFSEAITNVLNKENNG